MQHSSLKNYAAQECKSFLLKIQSYDLNEFYQSGGFNMILVSAEKHEPEFSYVLIDKFISFGADINVVNKSELANDVNALMMASLYEQPKMVKYLLQKGANVCVKNSKGKTAMDYLIPKNKRVLTPEKQKKIDEILPMLQVAMEQRNNCQ